MTPREKIHVGCSGWGYEDWVGPFYPPGTPSADFLRLYATVFDAVEIDSSFYRTPAAAQVAQWRRLTPEDFRFTAKLPRRITHELKLRNALEPLGYFQRSISELGPKLAAVVLQLPPSFKYEKDATALGAFLESMDPKLPAAVEFRHASWFRPDVYRTLGDRNVAMVWSTNQYLDTPTEVTADNIYLRMVGDREITEFNRIQKDQRERMKAWYDELAKAVDGVKQAFVFFNNHYAGFGPASVNEFRRLAGLMELEFPQAPGGQRQRSLGDFGA